MKVGADLQDDIHRAELLRKEIGYDKTLVCNSSLLSLCAMIHFFLLEQQENLLKHDVNLQPLG